MDGGAWKAAVHGVTQSQTRLKGLSSSSSITKAQQFFVLPDSVLFVLLYTALLEEIIAFFTS